MAEKAQVQERKKVEIRSPLYILFTENFKRKETRSKRKVQEGRKIRSEINRIETNLIEHGFLEKNWRQKWNKFFD